MPFVPSKNNQSHSASVQTRTYSIDIKMILIHTPGPNHSPKQKFFEIPSMAKASVTCSVTFAQSLNLRNPPVCPKFRSQSKLLSSSIFIPLIESPKIHLSRISFGKPSLTGRALIVFFQYNHDSFRAASSSPCGHGVIHDALTFSCLSPEAESLLSGTIPDTWCCSDKHLREFLASFVIPSQVMSHDEIPTSISDDDILYGTIKGWKESTSTSPFGRQLGHSKALIQHPTLLKCFSQFMNMFVLRGILAIP